MYHISIISASVRVGRKSHNVALYLQNLLQKNNLITVAILDLKKYDFPLFDERLKFQNALSLEALDFKNKIISSDGIIIVTPEYNGSIPASLKNVIDLLYDEWQNKPIAFSTVSSGEFGGMQALAHLQFVFEKIGAFLDATNFPVSKVQEMFDDFGVPTHKKQTYEIAQLFIDEFIRCIVLNQK